MFYLVDWGNGLVGGFAENFEQKFNTPKCDLLDSLKLYHAESIKVISTQELDAMRGFHRPTEEQCINANG